MKKSVLMLAMIAIAFFAFKNAPDAATRSKEKNAEFEKSKNYIAPTRNYYTRPPSSVFSSGTFLPGTTVAQSNTGQFVLVYQGDGNLVLWSVFPLNIPLWSSGPVISNPGSAVFTNTGVIALYNSSSSNYWITGDWLCILGGVGYYYAMQDDGNFVKYRGGCSESVSTRTHGGQYSLNWGTLQ